MKVILISIGIFQSYVNVNIEQLLKLGYEVVLITDYKFFEKVKKKDKIVCENSEKYVTTFDNNLVKYKKSKLNDNYRNGFWKNTSKRLFILYEYLKSTDEKNVLHIENDVLLYKKLEPETFDKQIYVTMDSENRCIPGIIYVPVYSYLEDLISNYNYVQNDMVNMANFYKRNKDICRTFPIIKKNKYYSKEKKYFEHYDKFKGIFDGAAMGQYLGGIDPAIPAGKGITIGFVNETCVVKYNIYKFVWEEGCPFIIIEGEKICIYNLHIHSKNLIKFVNM